MSVNTTRPGGTSGYLTPTGVEAASNKTISASTINTSTINSPTINTPTVDITTIDGQASAPANPAAGYYKSYIADSDGKLHILDSNGNDLVVGSGSSGRNYLSDWFDGLKSIGTPTNSIGDTLSSSDRTANKTTWGSSNTTNMTVSNTTSSPLRQTSSILLDSLTTTSAYIESPLFSIDSVDVGKPITVSFDMSGVSASDNYQVAVMRYNSSNVLQERIVIAGNASAITPFSAKLPTGVVNFNGFFISSATSTDQYAIRWYKQNSANEDVKIDSLYVGPQQVLQGAAVTDWQSYTPTLVATPTTPFAGYPKGYWRRVGDSMEVHISYRNNGSNTTGATGSEVTFSIPTGYTVDTAKLEVVIDNAMGYAHSYSLMTASQFDRALIITYAGSSTLRLIKPGGGTKIVGTEIRNDTQIDFIAKFPVTGWSSNVTVADRAVEEYASNYGTSATADDPTSFAYGAAGSQFANITAGHDKTVRFQTPILSTDKISVEVTTDGGVTWVDVSQSVSGITNNTSQTTTTYGMGWYKKNATDIYVNFGTYRGLGTGVYGAAGAAWSSIAASNTFKWRVRKVSGGASVGFPVSARNVVGDTSGQTVPSGYIGETIAQERLASDSISGTASTTVVNVTASPLVLTPGKWLITGHVNIDVSSAQITTWQISVSKTTATHNSYFGAPVGGEFSAKRQLGSGYLYTDNMPFNYTYTVTATTTYYLTASATFASGTNTQISGRIQAIRIA